LSVRKPATEVDNFTKRKELISPELDVSDLLNEVTNNEIRSAIAFSNSIDQLAINNALRKKIDLKLYGINEKRRKKDKGMFNLFFYQKYPYIKKNEISGLVDKWENLYLPKIKKRLGCKKKNLYEAIKNKIGGWDWARLETIIEEDERFEPFRREVTRKESIYKDLKITQTTIHMVKMASLLKIRLKERHIKRIAPSLLFLIKDKQKDKRYIDVFVGTDKIGHFTGIGYEYFKRAYLQKKGKARAIEYGLVSEQTYFGKLSTGFFSHADLVANYQGMIFWSRVLNETIALNDEFKGRPYIICKDGKWEENEIFDWRDYVDPMMDEGINCNTFGRWKGLLRKKNQSSKEYTKSIDRNVKNIYPRVCPLFPKYCTPGLLKKYTLIGNPIQKKRQKNGWGLIGPRCEKVSQIFSE
jgi:hypothetical protein